MRFPFSDTISGYVIRFNRSERSFKIRTSHGHEYDIYLTSMTFGQIVRNLEEPWNDATARIAEKLVPGQYIHVYGIYYPQGDGYRFEAKSFILPGEAPDHYRYEEPDWWIKQIHSIASSYMRWQFDYPNQQTINYRDYRTVLKLAGGKKGDFLQETDTISRLVYGLASAYLLTGEEHFLLAAEKGTEYLREHMRFYDTDEDLIYWYHGIKVSGSMEQKLLTSEFTDDYDSIPAYEQIYALTGPMQTYRITGDPRILWDAEKTIELFDKFYIDQEYGGFFSHLDPITLDPRAESLGHNRARKNWNSNGDHAPAYLVNLWLATGQQKYADFLEYTFDTLVKYLPDYEHSPFVQERFHADWSHDLAWGWQQNRAVIGHNLKLAWNLMRMYSLKPKAEYIALARKIGGIMPAVGSDQQRGGWYDVVERLRQPSEEYHRFVWHDRKAWWQQEQAILAYLILHGVVKEEPEYLRHAREATSFYNAYQLDRDDGGIYFNVLANGLPYLLGNERLKGSHSMSGYHSMELCYLAAVYTNLLITKQPLDLYFKPRPDGFADNILRVAPDILPTGSVRIDQAWIDDEMCASFDAHALTVALPPREHAVRVKVRIVPNV